MIKRLVLFGAGLIGGSLAMALREAGAVEEVIGCSRRAEHLAEAQRLGVIDAWTLDPVEACHDASVGVLAVPLGAMRDLAARIAPHWPEDALLTDVGSSKASVIEAVREGFGQVPARFVPGHPIAGTEKSGVAAAFPTLFRNRLVLLTPAAQTSPEATAQVADLWRLTGARVEFMTPEHHDRVLAATSHLPHVLAFALVASLAEREESQEIFQYAAGGFRDFTRIASSDPVMWRDVCVANRDAVLEAMDQFQEDLGRLRAAIARRDGATIEDCFARAKQARDRFTEHFARGSDT